jgi:hypothetical protein
MVVLYRILTIREKSVSDGCEFTGILQCGQAPHCIIGGEYGPQQIGWLLPIHQSGNVTVYSVAMGTR